MLIGVVLCLLCVLSVGNGAHEWLTGLTLSALLWCRVNNNWGRSSEAREGLNVASQKRMFEIFDVKGGTVVVWQAKGRMASRFFREGARG